MGVETVTSPPVRWRAWKFLSLRMSGGVTSWPLEMSNIPSLVRDLLLNDHAGRKEFDAALSYLAFFGVRIQFHQGVKKLRAEVLVLQSQRVGRLVSRNPLVDKFFIGQDQPKYSRSPPHVWRLESPGPASGRGGLLVLDHPCDRFQPGDF